ncbi:MAG: hypothetical protein ABIP29_12195 [Candidatus Eisenbacteria bacterium]
MNVEILYFEGCPHLAAARAIVHEAVSALGRGDVVREIEVTNDEEAIRLRFLGSPSVRVDGVDVEPAARERTDFAMTCRLYGRDGVVPRDLVRDALRADRA